MAISLVCLLAAALPAWSENLEIEHLLRYVEQSGCTFIRNDQPYTASSARSHLERKYGHAKRKIKNADQFIEYIGARSSWSGKAYQIRCGDHEQAASEWLMVELNRFRASLKLPEHETNRQSL